MKKKVTKNTKPKIKKATTKKQKVKESPKKTLAKKTKEKSKIEVVMKEFKEGKLHSKSKNGPKVKTRKQAIAIALDAARKEGENIKPAPVTKAKKKSKK